MFNQTLLKSFFLGGGENTCENLFNIVVILLAIIIQKIFRFYSGVLYFTLFKYTL